VLSPTASLTVSALELTGGTLTVQPGATLAPNSLHIGNGALILNDPLALGSVEQAGGVLSGGDLLELTGPFEWSGGTQSGAGTTLASAGAELTGGLKSFLGARTLRLAGGTTAWTGGNLQLNGGGATLRNESGSTLLVTGGHKSVLDAGNESGTVVNEGTLTVELSDATRVLTLSPGTLALGGAVHVDTGTLAVSSNASYTGSIDGPGTLRFAFAGSHAFAPGSSVTEVDVEIAGSPVTVASGATFDVDALALLGTNNSSLGGDGLVEIGGLFTWTGGPMQGNGTTRVLGGAVIDDDDPKILTGARVLELAGGITTWSEGLLDLGTGGSSLHNEAASTLQVTGAGRQLNPFAAAGPLVNAGTLVLALDAPADELLMPFGAIENGGTLELDTGVLRLGGSAAFAQTAGTTRLAAGTLLRINTGSQLQFDGGRLEGAGTVGADVTSAAEIAPGFSAGTLTVERHLTLLPGGALQLELGGTAQGSEHDFLSVGGNAALAGTLEPSFISDFENAVTPADGFTVLQAATPLTGSFSNAASGQRVLVAPRYDSLAVSYGAGSPFGANRVVLHDFQAFAANDVLQVTGTAQGGTITLVVNGVTVVVHTTSGQSADEVAEAIAAAIRAALGLSTQGIAGVAAGPSVQTNGDFQGSPVVTDPGLPVGGVTAVPALPPAALALLAGALLARARRIRRDPGA
jgi:hypothetical protein